MAKKAKREPAESIAKRLNAALRAKAAGDLMQALADLDEKHNGMRFHDRPDPLCMLGGLWAFHSAVSNGGMVNFLSLQEGAGFHQTEEWCKRIGATRARGWLREVAKLFPGGRVSQDQGARDEILEDLEADTSVANPKDALQRLDEKYEGAADEMAEAFRRYIVGHRKDFETALAAPAQRDGSPTHWSDGAEKALAQLKQAAIGVEARGRARQLLAEERGLRKPDGKEDPLMTTFFAALAKLDRKAWTRIAELHVSQARKMNQAREEIEGVRLDLSAGRMIPERAADRVRKPALKARDRARALLDVLPETITRNGRPFPLRKAAFVAMNDAWMALMVYDWLVVTQEGAGAARTVFAPFKGVAPLP